MRFEQLAKGLRILVQKEVYDADVLTKCFYWYTRDHDVSIRSASAEEFQVDIMPRGDAEALDPRMQERIQRDLIDFRLRHIVTKETAALRELIAAKAFAFEDDSEGPRTSISDPVGFHPDHTHGA